MSLIRPAWVEYVAALRNAEGGTVPHEIGARVWELSTRDDIFVYLTDLMTENATNTRAFEVAWDIWALMSGAVAA
ncbi:hypothetical protein [Nocardia australiensis]|uniref:hypothetical protein n=1 Tax=Nocardia australiensis TaxID=2887191 RepID=UPI001D14AC3A|nr:hypothetical protein [Nocardia australiensis]